MSSDDILAIARHVLTTLGGGLVSGGILTGSQLSDGVGAVVVLGGIVWSLWQKYGQRKALAAAGGVLQPKGA